MYGYVYKTTNLINSKIYIGQHISTCWDERYLGSGVMLRRAFKKYGKHNFKCELLSWYDNQQTLDEGEIYYINLFNARDTSVGYNIAEGGIGGSHPAWNKGLTVSDGRVKAYTLKRKQSYHGNIGDTNGRTTHKIKHINKILPEFKLYWAKHSKNEVCRYFHICSATYDICLNSLSLSEEEILSRKIYLKTRKYARWKKSNLISVNAHSIQCVETGKIFSSISEATRYLNLKSNSSLYSALSDSNKTCKKYHWIRL